MKRLFIVCLIAVAMFSCNTTEKELDRDILSLASNYDEIVKNADIAIQGDMDAYAKCVSTFIEIKKLHNAINSNILKLDAKSKKIEEYKSKVLNATTKNYVQWIGLGLHDMSFFQKEDIDAINKAIYPTEKN